MLLSFLTQTSHTAFYWSSQKRYAAAEEAHAETPFLAVLSAPHRKMVGLLPHATAKPLPWGPIREGVEVPLQRPPGIHQQHQSTKDTDGAKTSQIFDFFYRQRAHQMLLSFLIQEHFTGLPNNYVLLPPATSINKRHRRCKNLPYLCFFLQAAQHIRCY